MTLHISFDLETLSSAPDAAIISIGAVRFDPHGDDSALIPDASFYRVVDMTNAMKHGSVSGSTLKWWFSQTKDAQDAVAGLPVVSLKQAIAAFAAFTVPYVNQGGVLWSHATFDPPILQHAWEQVDVQPRLPFRKFLDLRTLTHLTYGDEYIDGLPEGTAHFALHDAWRQAVMVQRCYARMRREPISMVPGYDPITQ